MKSILIICGALTLITSIALADGISLAWNDCLGAGGATNRTFACNTNVGNNDLYVSFDPPTDVPDVNGAQVIIDITTPTSSGSIPPWWQLQRNTGCRITSLSTADARGSCVSLFGGGSIGYYVTAVDPSMPPNWARIVATDQVPQASAFPVTAGTEYTVMVIRIKNANTVGTACSGCADPLCLALFWVLLHTNNSGDVLMSNPLPRACAGAPGAWVSWQSIATPTLDRTWGQIKTLYR